MEDILLKLKAIKLEAVCTKSTNMKISEIMKTIHLIDFYGDDLDDIDEAMTILISEFSPVKSRLDSAHRNGLLIVENTKKAEEKQSIPRLISSIEDQLYEVKSRLLHRDSQITEAVLGLGQFLTSEVNVRRWIENRNSYLSLDTEIIRLQDIKEKLATLQRFNSTKIYEDIIKSMRKKLNKISEVCSMGSAANKMDNIERDDRSSDCRIRTQLVILKELVKEWEQCEKKIKELATRFYKPNFKKMLLKYQLKTSEKMKLDLSVQKTKVLKALEKLQFHLRSPIDSQHRRAAGEQIDQGELKTFCCQVGENYSLLLVCVKEDQGLLNDSVSQAEHQLKLADNPLSM